MTIIKNMTYEEALSLPDPKNIWINGSEVIVETEPEKVVPQSVTAYQARIALNQLGLLTAVENAVYTQGGDLRIRWTFSSDLHRDHPDVLAIAGALGWSETQLDDLFILASSK